MSAPARAARPPTRTPAPPTAGRAALARALRGVARYDHSLAVPAVGSLFRFDPASALGRAQADLARIYGAAFAYPATNGTTPLNVLALLTLAGPGDTVLIQRDAHVSVFAPLVHLGLRPAYLAPRFDTQLGVPLGVTPAAVRLALRAHPETRAVFLTYPNYYGVATDLQGCAAAAREAGVPLLVDAAHGAHLAFHPALPPPAERSGAAIVTQSTHKTGGALGQASLALFSDLALVERWYELVNALGFVSTSFSSVILLSLMEAVLTLHERGRELLEERLAMAAWARRAIGAIDGLCCFGAEARRDGFAALDPLRLTVDVRGTGATGYAVARELRALGHYAELATLDAVLFLVTLGTGWADVRRLVAALRRVAARPRRRGASGTWVLPAPPPPPPQILTPREVVFGGRARRRVAARAAVGQVAAETIAATPPGVAVIVAGEAVTAEVIAFLEAVRRAGGVLKGASDPNLATIEVVAEPESPTRTP
jgi:lysine decarboxylase